MAALQGPTPRRFPRFPNHLIDIRFLQLEGILDEMKFRDTVLDDDLENIESKKDWRMVESRSSQASAPQAINFYFSPRDRSPAGAPKARLRRDFTSMKTRVSQDLSRQTMSTSPPCGARKFR